MLTSFALSVRARPLYSGPKLSVVSGLPSRLHSSSPCGTTFALTRSAGGQLPESTEQASSASAEPIACASSSTLSVRLPPAGTTPLAGCTLNLLAPPDGTKLRVPARSPVLLTTSCRVTELWWTTVLKDTDVSNSMREHGCSAVTGTVICSISPSERPTSTMSWSWKSISVSEQK